METVLIKRVYEPSKKTDGFRVLADRLWPRGLKKEQAAIDLWLKDIAPSSDLRKWFNHKPENWEAFCTRYKAELKENNALKELLELIKKHKTVTLLYSAHDETHNNVVVLQQFVKELL
ncbi:DUF488 domain-containing protein [Rubrolithibacter danxiaensis]|uniref:DUF488 domain-containing protein n=1 Tax=Rubrolithibacter danxiaensis TaxID=3390805 RepID=UPI003BF88A77